MNILTVCLIILAQQVFLWGIDVRSLRVRFWLPFILGIVCIGIMNVIPGLLIATFFLCGVVLVARRYGYL